MPFIQTYYLKRLLDIFFESFFFLKKENFKKILCVYFNTILQSGAVL